VRADAEDPTLHPTAEILGVVREVEAQHPNPTLAPSVQPMLDGVPLTPENLYQRLFTARLGLDAQSRGRHADTDRTTEAQFASAPNHRSPPGVRRAHLQTDGEGNEAPPITRNAAWPPTDVKLSGAPFGFHDAMPR